MKKSTNNYEKRVQKICKEVERLLLEEGAVSHGIKISLEMAMDMVDTISYEVREKVKF